MKKTWLLTALAVITLAASYSFSPNKEERKYKNLKVLPKNISEKDLDSVMHHFTASLGVKCNFCHVRDTVTKKMDWVSDANKHKNIARQMYKMTQKVNDKYFDKEGIVGIAALEVTCYTCHRAKPHPTSTPPAVAQQGPPTAPPGGLRPSPDSAKKN